MTVLSEDAGSVSVTYQPYPQKYGTRTTSPGTNTELPIHCSTCDHGAPTEYCYHDDGVCITLSDTSIYNIDFQDGSLETDAYPLADGCTPRYLQRIHTTDLNVVCHESCFQLILRSGSSLTLHDLTCGQGQGGIVVEAPTLYGLNLFLIELDGNLVISTDYSVAGHPMDITPADCTEPLSLHPIFTGDQFILRCRTNDGEKAYFLHPHAPGAASISLESDPLSSPDGRTFAAMSNTTLQVYNIDNLEQYPGVKDFGIAITFCTYLDSDTLIVLLDGNNQILVHVLVFLNSAGEDGLTTLPHTSSLSTVHKLITPDIYATYNRTGSVYSIQLFNISEGWPFDSVSNLIKQPLDVFFVPGTGLPPPAPQPFPTPSSTSLPAPSTSELSSSLPSETPTAKPPDKAKPSKSTGEEPSSQSDTSLRCSHGCRVAVVVVTVLLAAAILVGGGILAVLVIVSRVLQKTKRQVKARGPYKQETDLEKGINVKLHIFSQPKYGPVTVSSSLQSSPSQLVTGRL